MSLNILLKSCISEEDLKDIVISNKDGSSNCYKSFEFLVEGDDKIKNSENSSLKASYYGIEIDHHYQNSDGLADFIKKHNILNSIQVCQKALPNKICTANKSLTEKMDASNYSESNKNLIETKYGVSLKKSVICNKVNYKMNCNNLEQVCLDSERNVNANHSTPLPENIIDYICSKEIIGKDESSKVIEVKDSVKQRSYFHFNSDQPNQNNVGLSNKNKSSKFTISEADQSIHEVSFEPPNEILAEELTYILLSSDDSDLDDTTIDLRESFQNMSVLEDECENADKADDVSTSLFQKSLHFNETESVVKLKKTKYTSTPLKGKTKLNSFGKNLLEEHTQDDDQVSIPSPLKYNCINNKANAFQSSPQNSMGRIDIVIADNQINNNPQETQSNVSLPSKVNYFNCIENTIYSPIKNSSKFGLQCKNVSEAPSNLESLGETTEEKLTSYCADLTSIKNGTQLNLNSAIALDNQSCIKVHDVKEGVPVHLEQKILGDITTEEPFRNSCIEGAVQLETENVLMLDKFLNGNVQSKANSLKPNFMSSSNANEVPKLQFPFEKSVAQCKEDIVLLENHSNCTLEEAETIVSKTLEPNGSNLNEKEAEVPKLSIERSVLPEIETSGLKDNLATLNLRNIVESLHLPIEQDYSGCYSNEIIPLTASSENYKDVQIVDLTIPSTSGPNYNQANEIEITSSEDLKNEMHIEDDFKQQLCEDTDITAVQKENEDSVITQSLSKTGLTNKSFIDEIPATGKTEKKSYQVAFVSTDEKENIDNNDPEWEFLKKLDTDEERYYVVRRQWKNLTVPDPNLNLTHYSFRWKNNVRKYNKDSGGYITSKRKRDSKEDSELLPNSKRRKFNNIRFNSHSIERTEYNLHNDYEIKRRDPQLNRFGMSQVEDRYYEYKRQLAFAKDEAEALFNFYQGLPNQIFVEQEAIENEQWDIDQIYFSFRNLYNWDGKVFNPVILPRGIIRSRCRN